MIDGLAESPPHPKPSASTSPRKRGVVNSHISREKRIGHPLLADAGAGAVAADEADVVAERIGVFVTPDQAADVWLGVISIFRDYGYRRLRTKARLKFLVAEWGPERFREVLETEYLREPLPDGPPPAKASGPGDHVGVHLQKDGRHYVGAAPVVGRISGDVLTGLADLMSAAGTDRVRLTPHQKLVVLDVAPEAVDDLVTGLDTIGLSVSPSPFRRHTMACTGIEFCKLAIVETKARARDLVEELERRFPELDVPITVNVNGCPNACARTQVADIGLKGQLVMHEGEQVDGFQVHLGGATGLQANFGRKLRAHKVTSEGLDDYVTIVVSNYLADRVPDESFATWVARADEELLRGEKTLEGAPA